MDDRSPHDRAAAGLVVVRAGEDDWEQVRAVRLAALAEAPGAFGSTLAEERQHDEEDWRGWCRGTATFLALREGLPVGIAAGVRGAGRDERTLVAMWLHPERRGSGRAAALLDAVRAWAVRDGATRLALWVTRDNQAAGALYRRAGFRATGASRPLPSDPAVVEERLVLDLR